MIKWLSRGAKKRTQSMAEKLSSAIHFEWLEQRYCMAGDTEGASLVVGALATPTFADQNQVAMIVRLSNGSEIICPIPGTVITSAMDVDLCIDGFVGPRTTLPVALASSVGMSFLSGHNASLVFDGAQDSREESSSARVHEWAVVKYNRPTIAPVEQLRVGDGNGLSTVPVVSVEPNVLPTNTSGVSATPATTTASATRELSAVDRKSSTAAAVDWAVGSSVLVGHAAAASGNSQRSEVAASDATGVWVVHSGTADASQKTGASALRLREPAYGPLEWTDLQTYRAPSPLPSSDATVRPQLTALTDVQFEPEFGHASRESLESASPATGRMISYLHAEELIQRLPQLGSEAVPELVAEGLGEWTGWEARPTVELKVSAEDEPELEAAAEPSRVPSYRLWYVAVIAALFVRPARSEPRSASTFIP